MLQLQGSISPTGTLQVFNIAAYKQWKDANIGKDIIMSLKIKRAKRSNPQNAYYHGVIIPLIMKGINDMGHSFDEQETHDFLKKEFNCEEIEVIEGHYIKMPQSTTKMDTKEFMTYIDKIQQFAATMLNVYIPGPNEQTTIVYSLNQ